MTTHIHTHNNHTYTHTHTQKPFLVIKNSHVKSYTLTNCVLNPDTSNVGNRYQFDYLFMYLLMVVLSQNHNPKEIEI